MIDLVRWILAAVIGGAGVVLGILAAVLITAGGAIAPGGASGEREAARGVPGRDPLEVTIDG